MDDTSSLSKLGSTKTEYKTTGPCVEMLETFPNQYPGTNQIVRHECFEFTSLCPKTGQPDFAGIIIEFTPGTKCVETKSLKLYLFAFRNEGSFMETLTNKIADDLYQCMEPVWLKVTGKFNSRGGIATTVVALRGDAQ